MFRKIMILVDEHPQSQTAIAQGVEVARTHGAHVVFLHLPPAYAFPMADMPGGGMAAFAAQSAEEFEQQTQATAADLLQSAEAEARSAGVASVGAIGPGDASVDYVVEALTNRGCDLVVVASSGSNAVVRLLTGDIIPGLISRSPVPVLICPLPT
ncbi:universal stress protein [Paracidovorax sp. MALMAid1276]|uniref:universal stress protein n=1 Tax=Paracidovorax sp. MALMAid1276 TaxID=3411631 RepID=UPI003B9B5AB9